MNLQIVQRRKASSRVERDQWSWFSITVFAGPTREFSQSTVQFLGGFLSRSPLTPRHLHHEDTRKENDANKNPSASLVSSPGVAGLCIVWNREDGERVTFCSSMENREVSNQPLTKVNTDQTATTTAAAKTTVRTNQNKTMIHPPPTGKKKNQTFSS